LSFPPPTPFGGVQRSTAFTTLCYSPPDQY
jgi:hypothetical protein